MRGVNILTELNQQAEILELEGEQITLKIQEYVESKRTEIKQQLSDNINMAISEMTEIITRSLTPNIEVKYILTDDLWLAEIDNGDFCDALINLCINARDNITDHGNLTIETCNTSLDDDFCTQNPGSSPGQYIELVVTDTGQGISTDLKDRIFEPFFTTKDQGKGTGLGLAMVYAFVERSNGYQKLAKVPTSIFTCPGKVERHRQPYI